MAGNAARSRSVRFALSYDAPAPKITSSMRCLRPSRATVVAEPVGNRGEGSPRQPGSTVHSRGRVLTTVDETYTRASVGFGVLTAIVCAAVMVAFGYGVGLVVFALLTVVFLLGQHAPVA